MESNNYTQEHPLYTAMAPIYRRNAALYDGGESIDGGRAAKLFLTQHRFEKNEQYDTRVKRAAYRNYAAPTVDLFASSVTDGVKREGFENIPEFQNMRENCDRQGNTPDRFFKNVCTRAAAVGIEFVLVDMPRATGEARTRAQAKQQGLEPYFVSIPAMNLIAWDFDPADGSLAWAVIRDTRSEAKDGPFSSYMTVTTITLWTREKWEKYESRDGKNFASVDGGPNPAKKVPIVPFIYEADSPMTGRAVTDDVASLIIRVFNQDSELDKMLFDAALPILAAFGLRNDEEEEALLKATSALWRFGGTDMRLEYVEPSGAAFSAKRQQILDDIESIREISLRQTRPRGAQVESAEAKRLDTVQLSSQLADFARTGAAAEKQCWDLAGELAGVAPKVLESVLVQYNENFDPESVKEKLTTLYVSLRKSRDLSRETVWRHLGMDDDRVKAEKLRLQQEDADESSDSGYAGAGV